MPPPRTFSPQRRSLLTEVAEYPSDRHSLPQPGRINDPEFFPRRTLGPGGGLLPAMEESLQFRIDRTPEPFLRRRVVFEVRNLITL